MTALIENDQTAELSQLPGLLPFLPMLYIAWSDAVLTPSQLQLMRIKISQHDWLTDAEKSQLQQWLDPANPPTVAEMKSWLRWIKKTTLDLAPHSRQSLSTLGLQIASLNAPETFRRCATPEACLALDELEEILGVISTEAYQALLAEEERPRLPAEIMPQEADFDVDAMTALLDRDHPLLRQRVRYLLNDPVFAHRPHPDKTEYRERMLHWSQLLADQGLGALAYPPEYGGTGDITQYLTVMEILSHHDLSLVIKFGVQFGLFGGSIALLGTEKHHQKYLHDVGTLALPGCFAMTELGHGSNVRDLETIAVYEGQTDEFIIHTPSLSARKEYIGNAAAHGRLATVFAQLKIEGESYGVNAFLVPIRSSKGDPLPGVTIEDNGWKMGLNGVDNGRLSFDHVRIPRENMLDRFAQVLPNGHYISNIAGESRRFFTMIGTLVGGRVGIARAALSAAKTGLTIAIRYARRRRQFGPEGEPETLLLDYQTHQRRLIPHLATAYALDFALKYLTRRYVQRTEKDSREVEALAAGLKAYSSWYATRALQTGREACGGQGYMAVNRFADLKADTDIFTTFEGDNTVLMQLVAKARLTEFQQQFHDEKLFGLVKFIAGQTLTSLTELNPIVTRRTDPDHLREHEFHLAAFRYRETHLLTTAAQRLKKRIDQGEDSYQAFINVQQHLVNLAEAYVERVVLEQFVQGITESDDLHLTPILGQLAQLFALHTIEQHSSWYLEHGYLSGSKMSAIRTTIKQLLSTISNQALPLVDAFAIPDMVIGAPIALT